MLTKKQTILIISSIFLIGLGFFLKDNLMIFRKAIFICMECIGIG